MFNRKKDNTNNDSLFMFNRKKDNTNNDSLFSL